MTSPSAASPAASAPRLLWIDLLRGFLMLAIIFDHTEICFTGDNIVPYRMYVPDVLMAFFFLSGYLFYRPEGFRLRHKLHSWLRGVLMPYFIFTSALALPKAWLHGDGGSLSDLLLTILTGQGSWFIASLAVAELLFLTSSLFCAIT
jgi:fucose 4-O-acetylase-like acetyltransferase